MSAPVRYHKRGPYELAYIRTPSAAERGEAGAAAAASAADANGGTGAAAAGAHAVPGSSSAERLGVVYLPGLISPMDGPKEVALEAFVRDHLPQASFLRFDYAGHGLSSGTFTGTHLGDWFLDSLAIIDEVAPEGRLIVVGSSMGGLLAVHLALRRPSRVAALVLIAPAIGFIERRWDKLPEADKALVRAGGAVSLKTGYPGDGAALGFFEAAAPFALPEAPGSVAVRCPVRILHGRLDAAVPSEVGARLAAQIAGDDVTFTEAKDGNHKFASPRDLEMINLTVAQLAAQLARAPPGGAGAGAGAGAAANGGPAVAAGDEGADGGGAAASDGR